MEAGSVLELELEFGYASVQARGSPKDNDLFVVIC